jgi:uncharacterized protein YbcI
MPTVATKAQTTNGALAPYANGSPWSRSLPRTNLMNEIESAMAEQVAQVAIAFQTERTGHAPTSVTVVLGGDTLVITLHDALTPVEKALALRPGGATQVQEFHRQLFLTSADSLRKEIKRITGREVREAVAEVDPGTGSVVHAFTSGTTVQVFLLNGRSPAGAESDSIDRIERAEDDGLPMASDVENYTAMHNIGG